VVLAITDQATFAVGEDVLLYLEARPRDGTLYTSALWQGKWEVQRGNRGQQVAVRYAPHDSREERQSLGEARFAAASAGASAADRIVAEAVADENPFPRASAQFNLLGPFRYLYSPAVDVQNGGQPGLAGGGFAEVQRSIRRWTDAGSSFRYTLGDTNAAARCSGQRLGNGRVTITFMDPCGEMSNSGGTLALGGSYFVPGEGGTANGQAFDRAIEGFIVNNDSPLALNYLTNSGCFEDVQTHELGHVLGLNHSSDPNALMYVSISASSCSHGARGLMRDDIDGLLFIYGRSSSLPAVMPAPPTNVRVTMRLPQLTVSWNAAEDAIVLQHRVDFRAGHFDGGAVLASVTATGTSVSLSVPASVAGAFNVVVTPLTPAGDGPASARVDFSIGNALTPCASAPAPVGNLQSTVANGFARVQWASVDGATRYLIQAGRSRGTADLFPQTDVGVNTVVGAPVPSGFAGWVRVYAVNECGTSAPVDAEIRN
jgi:hypothetical protein